MLPVVPCYADSSTFETRIKAELGDARAQTELGSAYVHGQGVTQDYAEAVKWYRKAADQGYDLAQSNLGVMYSNGQGVTRDDAEALRWDRKAADQGFAPSQYNLGVVYANGEGVTRDDTEAVQWYRKAADQGYAPAQSNLGVMYANGRGVPQDNAEAAKWFHKAADQGNSVAQSNLAAMQENERRMKQEKTSVVQDRTAVLPSLEKLCENYLLARPQDLSLLAMLRINVPDFCGCMSTQIIARFSPGQVVAYSQSRQLPLNFNSLWQETEKFCYPVLMRPE